MFNKSLDFRVSRLEKKLAELEKKAFKNARKETTKISQQLLLLHHIGFLDILNDLKMSREKKAIFLSVLLNGSMDNIRDYLTEINKKNSGLKNEINYEFLVSVFKKSGLTKQEEAADKILDEILKAESEKP